MNENVNDLLTCVVCEITDESVAEVLDPYKSEIYNIEELVCLCPTCYNQIAEEI